MTIENIRAGFAKYGILSFNPDAIDYRKVEATATQQNEGVDQRGLNEVPVKTQHHLGIIRASQTEPILNATTKHQRLERFNYNGSLCDMFIENAGNAPLLNRHQKIPFMKEEPSKDTP